MAVRQLARIETEILASRSAGTWQWTSGTDHAAMVDETIRDGTTTEVITPNVNPATHVWEGKFGANWDGNPLARPFDNTSMQIQIDYKVVVSAMTLLCELYEGATLRETKDFGATASTAGAYKTKYWNVAAATVDAIQDFTDLRVRFTVVQNAANERTGFSYVDLRMGSTTGPALGFYRLSFAGLSAMPRSWTQECPGSNVATPVTVASDRLDPPAQSVLLMCHALDLPADSFSKITYAPGHDSGETTGIGAGPHVRCNPIGAVPGTDTWRYNAVSNTIGPQWETELDGIPNVVFDTELYSVTAGPVGGDTLETRIVGALLQGLKNGTVILSTALTDPPTIVTAPGIPGLAFQVPDAGRTRVGISVFEMGSVPLPLVGHSRASARMGLGL